MWLQRFSGRPATAELLRQLQAGMATSSPPPAMEEREDGPELELDVRVPTVRLQSCDGKTFAVPVSIVRVSRTIDTMLKG